MSGENGGGEEEELLWQSHPLFNPTYTFSSPSLSGVEEWRVFKRLQESYEDQQRCHVFGCLQKLPCNNITLPHIKSDVRNHFVCVDKSVYEAHYKVELGEPDLNLKTIRNDFHWLKLFGYNRPL